MHTIVGVKFSLPLFNTTLISGILDYSFDVLLMLFYIIRLISVPYPQGLHNKYMTQYVKIK